MGEHILSHSEIEVFVSNIIPSKLDELVNLSWFESHKRLHMLYQEALFETINSANERIKETFLLHGKIKVLVQETICMSVWRLNIFPYLTSLVDKEKVFAVYIMLYHEATVFGLLESLTFHVDSMDSLQETAVELLDYCVHSILQIINRKIPQVLDGNINDVSAKEQLEQYEAIVVHNLGIKSICILRYIAEAFDLLPLSITSRFYNNHDIPMLLCQVIELAPWFTTDLHGKPYHFLDDSWKKKENSDNAINKSEGQAWLCIRQVLLDERFLQHYELNDYRSRQLSKLIRYLHDEMLDQLSPLAELKHFLCQLSVANFPPPQSRPLILEIVAEYRNKIMHKFENKWHKLAVNQADIIKDLDIKEIQSIAQGLAQAYSTLDMIDPEPPKCANCGEHAAKRCSRCRSEWYCGRECQVKKWGKHKVVCTIETESSN